MARQRRSKAGSLADLQRAVWAMIRRVEALSTDDPPPERVLRCAHALSQLTTCYTRLTESTVLEERLSKLEASMATGKSR
jgi:hypothetical protein